MLEKIHKPYWSYEKEEVWLNKMSSMGLQLRGYTWCTYFFERGTPGEYTYRIELLENLPSHPESRAYLSFLEETGVEYICSWIRWVYLRKKTADGPFNLYSDLDSRISHFRRVLALMGAVLLLNLFPFLMNMGLGIYSLIEGHPSANMFISLFNMAVVIGLTPMCVSYIKRIFKLRKEKRLRE